MMQNQNFNKKRPFEEVSNQEMQTAGSPNKKRKPDNPKKMSFQSFKIKKSLKMQQVEQSNAKGQPGDNAEVLIEDPSRDQKKLHSGENSNGPTSGSSQAHLNQNTQFMTQAPGNL